jgi:hypothetical protein
MHSSIGTRDEGQSSQSKGDFSIGFTLTRSRDLLRRILQEHAPDDASEQLAARVVQHLRAVRIPGDEDDQALRRKPSAPLHRTPGE